MTEVQPFSTHHLHADSSNNVFSVQTSLESLGGAPSGSAISTSGSSSTLLRKNERRSEEFKLVERTSAMDRTKNRLKDFTINKLNIDSIGLIGRQKEVSILKDALQRTTTRNQNGSGARELVVIGGYSGVGKTSLAKAIKEEIMVNKERTTDGMFVVGKFDQNKADEPYSGIAKAFGEICERIQALDDRNLVSEIAKSIVDNLGDDVVLLVHLIPELEGVLMDHFNPTLDVDFDIFNIQNGLEQWKFALRILTRVLCSHFAPLVLLIDDFQWADASSIDALDYMISDVDNPNPLMIQICYRSNEVDDDGVFKRKLKSLEEKKKKFQFSMAHIDLECCNEDDVNEIIMNMMSMNDADATSTLAKVCFKRTLGNPYFLIQFMMMLKEEGLISFNLGLVKWVWKEKEIENATMSTTNVVALLQNRMRKLKGHVQRFMQYAACLGASFRVATLRLVWEKHAILASETTDESVDQWLSLMQSEHLIEPSGLNSFRWVHDKVQEAALSLSSERIDELKFEIGTTLFQSLNEKELEEQLFDVVDLVNKGEESGSPKFAHLNHRAAKKARGISGLYSAAKYVERGLWQLQDDHRWTANREMLLGLYTIGVEVEIALGNGEKAEEYGKAIVTRDDFSIMEKLPIKIALLGKICFVDMEFDRAIDSGLKLLKDLGYSMIWSKRTLPIQAIHCLMGTMKLAKKPGLKARCEGLGPMTDPKHKALLNLVAAICYAAYMVERTFLNVVGVSKMIELTMTYGVDENTGPGFTAFGMLMVAVRQDFDMAKEFAEVGLGLRKVAPLRDGATMFNSYFLTLPWKLPLVACVEKLNRAYTLAMRSGDSPYAMWSLMGYLVWLPYSMGKGLQSIIKETPKALAQAEELRQVEHEWILKMLHQMMLNLTSTSATNELQGDVFSTRDYSGKNPILVGTMHFAEGELLTFSDLRAAADRAVKHGDKFSKLCPAVPMVMLETFHRGVALYAMARRTKKRKYKSKASKIRKTFEKWFGAGNPNIVHCFKFLNAEHAALGKKKQEAQKLYVESITLAARTGHLHHAALLNERYADFLTHDTDLKDEAAYRIEKAIEYYREWGAMGKVQMLEKQLEDEIEKMTYTPSNFAFNS
mmetsp:Transcript_42708/g.103293  ORF Transcript_42708/g.103293 Transcript_42708/m.103293 type:complete len:1107 (-) Transcript_42708:45-3365(-)